MGRKSLNELVILVTLLGFSDYFLTLRGDHLQDKNKKNNRFLQVQSKQQP